MKILTLGGLPPRTGKGAILKLLIEQGDLTREQVGKIEMQGRQALVEIEIPSRQVGRLVKRLDGVSLNHTYLRAWLGTTPAPTTAGPPDDDDYFARLSRLLTLEAEAAEQQLLADIQRRTPAQAEQRGYTLVNLTIVEQTAGLGGRILLTLAKRGSAALPWNRLTVGRPVMLTEEESAAETAWRGVVSRREADTIQVALNDWPEAQQSRPTFRLDVAADAVALQRQRSALQRAGNARGERLAELRRILLGQTAPHFERPPALPPQPMLNDGQQAAVAFALSAADAAIIHGPPGTGKTTTVAALIQAAVQRGESVLACAPSNLAVDNIFERLLAAGVRVLRLGHPARVLPQLREHTLDVLVENHPEMRDVRRLRRDAFALRDRAGSYRRSAPAPGERQAQRREAKQMLTDARRMEAQLVERLLNQADVICATLTGLDSELLGQRQFDLCVIDEACQSTEPENWIPLLRSRRLVLAGDHCQLPPTVISPEAVAQGFGVSLLERLMAGSDGQLSRRLSMQYRMHQAIMDFSSREFYDGSLQAADSVAGHLLCDLPGVARTPLTETAIDYIDTAGAGYDEVPEADGDSRYNPEEAALVGRKVAALLAAGLSAADIAVITPYSAQVRRLQETLPAPQPEINSVDGFQGREKEAVIISLVRANAEGQIGFLADERRMNVALTRARRKLIVIGDSGTITVHPFYRRLVEYFEQLGAYRSVWEELV